MAEAKESEVEKAIAYDKQTSIKLVTKYEDNKSKQQVNETNIPQIGLGVKT